LPDLLDLPKRSKPFAMRKCIVTVSSTGVTGRITALIEPFRIATAIGRPA